MFREPVTKLLTGRMLVLLKVVGRKIGLKIQTCPRKIFSCIRYRKIFVLPSVDTIADQSLLDWILRILTQVLTSMYDRDYDLFVIFNTIIKYRIKNY